jgi:RNA polymerase I-specific transcription initiation factor RRN5
MFATEEKSVFFAALLRLGNRDIPGIARAIGTKSIPEVQTFHLLLQDGAAKQRLAKPTLFEMSAALEISVDCDHRLELAGDAIADYQERFEAKQERERYGDYWLITPAIAEELTAATKASRQPSLAPSSPAGPADARSSQPQDAYTNSEILQQIPEAELLNPSTLLNLSSSLFMNGSPSPPSWFPHWSTLASPLASEPSIYQTAFKDLHTLVVSLTQRLVQFCIMQATSRLRSQGWRVKKGVLPFVKKRDVLTAVDILNLQRNGKERWRGVARRCGLVVLEGVGKQSRQMDWDEVEENLSQNRRGSEPSSSGDEQATELPSDVEEKDFKSRAVRSGTPLPKGNTVTSNSDVEDASPLDYSADESDAEEGPSDTESLSSLSDSVTKSTKSESRSLELENFDNEASRTEEQRLWNILGVTSSASPSRVKVNEDEWSDSEADPSLMHGNDWRKWVQYHAEWEEFEEPTREDVFRANQRLNRPTVKLGLNSYDPDTAAASQPSSGEERSDGPSRKRRKITKTELPVRGARAYAALQDRQLASEKHEPDDEASEDDAKFATSMYESPTRDQHQAASLLEDDSDMDAKPLQSVE